MADALPGRPARLATLAALLALVVLAFRGVLGNGWIAIDDPAYVLENPHVRGGWSAANALWLLTHADCGNWSPVTALSHLLDVSLFGLHAGAHHAESLAWHAVNAVLLLIVLHRMTGAWWRSAVVAALFAVHPLRVESVAWVASRKDLLSTFFLLLALAAWRRWTLRPGAGRYALVATALVLGLLAKPMLVTLPFVLLLLDAWPLRRLELAPLRWRGERGLRARVGEKLPLFAVVAAFSAITYVAQRGAGALAIVRSLTFPQRASNALTSYWMYVRKSFWPEHLTVYYPHPRGIDPPAATASLLALAAVTVLAWRVRRTRPWLFTGWAWFVGTLVPVIGLVQFGPQAWADRFSYLPAIGLALALVWEVGERAAASRPARFAAAAAALVAVAALALGTVRQVERWRDTRTLFTWTASIMPGNTVVRLWLADQFMREGRPSAAIPEYEAVLRAEPRNATVHDDLAIALGAVGRLEEARMHLAAALRIEPTAEAWHNLGTLDERTGRHAQAIDEFARSLELDPTHVNTRMRMATALVTLGRYAEAAEQFGLVLQTVPGDSSLQRQRDAALAAARRR